MMVKPYDLEERTQNFASELIGFVNVLQKTITNVEIIRQVTRSGTSIGANYIEANEALSKKDFANRVKICRKEAKETCYWLRLISIRTEDEDRKRQAFAPEASELTKIFGAIVEKTKT
jgi:four helix bundle protein